jgi:hypothetical protein
MSISDILATYKLVYSGPNTIARVEVVDTTKGAHVSDPAQGILPWHGYVGAPLPADALAQVTNVRASLLALDPGLSNTALVDNPRFIIKRCTGRNIYFPEQRNRALLDKLRPELAAEVSRVRSDLAVATDDATTASLRKELAATLAFKHLMVGGSTPREGVAGAINTYDPAVITWGMGWAITGYLGKVLAAVYEVEMEKERTDPDKHSVQKLLYLAGFLYDRGTYYVVDTAAKTVWSTTTGDINACLRSREGDGPPDNAAMRVIHDTHELHVAWALLGRDDLTRDTLIKSQLRTFKATTGDVPQADKIQTAALYTFVAHLQHWTGGKLDVVAWANGPRAQPGPVTEILPSEKGDAQLAVQAVHLLYSGGRPSFKQVRDYWRQMTTEDAAEEGLTEFTPVYSIMTAPPVASVPDDHLKVVDSGGTWDLGPLSDFSCAPVRVQSPIDPPDLMKGLDLNYEPETYDPAGDAERRQREQSEEQPSILRYLSVVRLFM